MSHPVKIGLLVGSEWGFPPAFLEEINRREDNVIAEYVRLGGTRMDEPIDYALLVDRISHEVAYYRTFLKHAVVQGVTVINDPFLWSANNKFFEASLSRALDIPTPRTVALPMKSYPYDASGESLRNLSYPLDWPGLVDTVGLPAILKDAWGLSGHQVYRIENLDELLAAYDGTGERCMILQEYIEADAFIHCFCIGPDKALVMRYDPRERRYLVDEDGLAPGVRSEIIGHTQRLNRALGYDINRVEFAVRDDVAYAIDLLNPAPEIDINSMTPRHFRWMVEAMADYAIYLAKNPRSPREFHRWAHEVPKNQLGW